MGVGPPRLGDWSQLVPQPLCPASLPTVGPGQRNRWPGLCSQVCSRPTGPLGRVPLWREGSAASTADMGRPAAYRPTGKTGRGAWWAPGCSRPPSTSRRCRLLCPLGVSAGTRVTPLRSGPCPCPYPTSSLILHLPSCLLFPGPSISLHPSFPSSLQMHLSCSLPFLPRPDGSKSGPCSAAPGEVKSGPF